jgi:hypothetical protein
MLGQLSKLCGPAPTVNNDQYGESRVMEGHARWGRKPRLSDFMIVILEVRHGVVGKEANQNLMTIKESTEDEVDK